MAFEFGPQAVQELREIARRVLREEIPYDPGARFPPHSDWFSGTFHTTGGITARAGNTPGTGTGTLYYISTAGLLTQHSTVAHTVRNVTTSSVGAGNYIHGKMDVFGTIWLDTEDSEGATPVEFQKIVRVKANAFFAPGSTGASMDMLEWNSVTNSWDDSGSDATCRNTNNDCCMTEDEENWAIKLGDDDYDLQGFGLFRRAETNAAIDIGASGSADLSGVITSSANAVTINNGDTSGTGFRKIFSGEDVWVRYLSTQEWHVVSIPRVVLAGKPTAQLQSGSSGTFAVYYLDSGGTWTAWGSNTVTARNTSGMTMETDFLYSLTYYSNSEIPNAFPIEIEVF